MNAPSPTRPSRVFVTGAGGFIGRALLGRFREMGADAAGVDILGDPAAGIVAGSTLDPSHWQEQLAGAELVIHTAAIVSTVAPLRRAWRVNVLGTRRVLDAAVAAGVPRFVFLSSTWVWGETFPDGVTEEDPPVVQGRSYPDTKIAGEAVVLAAHAAGRIDATIIRPGDVYGPGSRPWVVLPLQLIRRNRLVLPGHGRGILSPVAIDDLVDGIVAASCQAAGRGGVFTITGGQGVECRDYFGRLASMVGGRTFTIPSRPAIAMAATAGALERALGRDSELSAATARMMLRRGTYSIEKAGTMLGYRPSVDLDEGMHRTQEWLVAQGLA